jgi:MFS family permease
MMKERGGVVDSARPEEVDAKGEAAPVVARRRYARYVLGLLFAANVVSMLDRQVLTILVQPIQDELAISDTAMGLLTGLGFAFVYSLAGLPVARWADRGVRRSILAGGIVVWSALTILMGFAQGAGQLFAARMGLGVAQTTSGAPAQSLLSDYFPPERRGGAIAVLTIGGGVGIALALLMGGWVNQLYGWRTALMVAGLPGFLLALLVRLTLREPIRGAAEQGVVDSRRYSTRETLGYMWGLRSFRHILATSALHAFASLGTSVWLPTFLARAHALGSGEIGSWLAGVSALGMIGTFLGGRLSDRLGGADPRWSMWLPAISTAVAIPFYALFLLSSTMPAGFGFYVFATFFGAMWAAPCFAMVQGLARVSMRATAAALLSLTLNLMGLGLGPLLVGVLSDWLTPEYGREALRYALLVLLVAHAWAGVHHLLAARTLREDLRTGRV